jgi:hypothetical protein
MRKANAVDGTALGHWVELTLNEPPWKEVEPFVGFVFLDPDSGLSARGGRAGDPTQAEEPSLTVRLPIGVPGRVIGAAEAATRGLPINPGWVARFGPQPPTDAPWREDVGLRGRFHPQWPDDLQVLIDDGGGPGELCWLRIVEAADAGTYVGQLMHPPHALTTVKEGDRLRFALAPGARHPRRLT